MFRLLIAISGLVFLIGCGYVDRNAYKDNHEVVLGQEDGENQEKQSEKFYIFVGDSTRATSNLQGGTLYQDLHNAIIDSGHKTKLMARKGHSLDELNHDIAHPSTKDIIEQIKGDGDNTIVDISLGLNDVEREAWRIKQDLEESIEKIQEARPAVTITLTTPTRLFFDAEDTDRLRDIYHEVSDDMGLTLYTVIDSLMETKGTTPSSWYQKDGIHLSEKGQHEVAHFMLDEMGY